MSESLVFKITASGIVALVSGLTSIGTAGISAGAGALIILGIWGIDEYHNGGE